MRKVICYSLFFFVCAGINAQVKEPASNSNTEQQLENITENNADVETEDDSYLQEMAQYQKNPLNINTASESMLKNLRVLSPVQIQNLIDYKNLLGKLINIYELQAVPGWDIATIQKIRGYVVVNDDPAIFTSLKKRMHGGDNTLLARLSQVLEKSQGYKIDPAAGKNYYQGSPQKLFLRYRYNYKNLLQYGIIAEKDAGEQFFKGSQKQGFDFYSAHFFLSKAGIIKSLALGDFTVNMGQGLTQWMSLAFKKGPDVLSTKRQADILRPYNSAGEINFHRGVGLTLAKGKWEATLFGSYKNVDANFITDTSQTAEDFVSSLQISGFHRTKSEVADKGIQKQLAFGGNFSYLIKRLHVGINAIQYNFKYPLQKQADPYNLYALSGKSFGNYSVDYGYTYKNMHFYGEAAATDKKYTAFINGILISTAANVDMSFVYRNISKGYQSLYTSAFTENSLPTNEKGFFSGITVRPTAAWRVDAYADFYRFPWLKYRINAPTTGSDFLIQFTYTPSKFFEMYARFKSETKSINYNLDNITLSPVIPQPKQNFRTQFSYKLSREFTFRSRAEAVWYDKKGQAAENGFLLYGDVLYTPYLKPYSGNIRLQYFETDGYNSRLYAYENDVLFSYSIPLFYGKGYRYYINFNMDLTKKITAWIKLSRYVYINNTTIGSALDLINVNHKTEIKCQLLYKL